MVLAIAKTSAFEFLYTELVNTRGDKKLNRLAKARERRARYLDQVKCINDEDDKVLLEEVIISRR